MKGSLDDTAATVASTTFKFYLLGVTPVAQTPIVYLLGEATQTEAIIPFTYAPTTFPWDSAPTFTYTLAEVSGLDKIATIDSATGTDILAGVVNDVSDGSL